MITPTIKVPSSFASWRQILQFAVTGERTGWLEAVLPEEKVFIFVAAGAPIIISSSNSELFGEPVRSQFDLAAIPPELREAAAFAQRETGLPFHVYLRSAGTLTDRRTLLAILRRAGSETLARLDAAESYHASFTEGEVPAFARAFACDYEATGLFLDSYRRLAEAHLPADGLLCSYGEPPGELGDMLTPQERKLLEALHTQPIRLSHLTPQERTAAYVLTRVDLASIHQVPAGDSEFFQPDDGPGRDEPPQKTVGKTSVLGPRR